MAISDEDRALAKAVDDAAAVFNRAVAAARAAGLEVDVSTLDHCNLNGDVTHLRADIYKNERVN